MNVNQIYTNGVLHIGINIYLKTLYLLGAPQSHSSKGGPCIHDYTLVYERRLLFLKQVGL